MPKSFTYGETKLGRAEIVALGGDLEMPADEVRSRIATRDAASVKALIAYRKQLGLEVESK